MNRLPAHCKGCGRRVWLWPHGWSESAFWFVDHAEAHR